MGTRDIYVAVLMTILFVICVKFLFNEDSAFCCLPEQFTEYHISLSDENEIVSDDQIKQAKELLERAEKQKSKTAPPTTTDESDESDIPPHLTKMDRRVRRKPILMDDEPYHPWV